VNILEFQRFLGSTCETSARNNSVQAEWLRQSGRAPLEPSETPVTGVQLLFRDTSLSNHRAHGCRS